MVCFFINSIHAINLGINPSKIDFNGEVNHLICKNFSLLSSQPNLYVFGEDKWSSNKNSRNIRDYTRNSSNFGIEIKYPKQVQINDRKIMDLCLKTDKSGEYSGVLIYITNSTIAIGMWIKVESTQDKNTNPTNQLASITGKATSFAKENQVPLKYASPLIASTLICLITLIILVRINSQINRLNI